MKKLSFKHLLVSGYVAKQTDILIHILTHTDGHTYFQPLSPFLSFCLCPHVFTAAAHKFTRSWEFSPHGSLLFNFFFILELCAGRGHVRKKSACCPCQSLCVILSFFVVAAFPRDCLTDVLATFNTHTWEMTHQNRLCAWVCVWERVMAAAALPQTQELHDPELSLLYRRISGLIFSNLLISYSLLLNSCASCLFSVEAHRSISASLITFYSITCSSASISALTSFKDDTLDPGRPLDHLLGHFCPTCCSPQWNHATTKRTGCLIVAVMKHT